jgi:hypothetical protein
MVMRALSVDKEVTDCVCYVIEREYLYLHHACWPPCNVRCSTSEQPVLGAAPAEAGGEDISGRGQQLDHVRILCTPASCCQSWLLAQILLESERHLPLGSSAAADILQPLTSGRYGLPWVPCAT